MNPTKKKNLALRNETLRNLAQSDLRGVVGGGKTSAIYSDACADGDVTMALTNCNACPGYGVQTTGCKTV
jgi:hypothetical protein